MPIICKKSIRRFKSSLPTICKFFIIIPPRFDYKRYLNISAVLGNESGQATLDWLRRACLRSEECNMEAACSADSNLHLGSTHYTTDRYLLPPLWPQQPDSRTGFVSRLLHMNIMEMISTGSKKNWVNGGLCKGTINRDHRIQL